MRGPIGRNASYGDRAVFACVVLLAATSISLSGQERSAAAAGSASGSAQPVKRDYRFEVASIRPVGSPTGLEYPSGVVPPSYTPGHYRNEKQSLAGLAVEAFGVKRLFEIAYPRWMDSTYFAVRAVLPEGATNADLPIMIQHLLEDRFGLVFHHEMRQMAGFELVMVKPRPQLAKSAGPAQDPSTVKGVQVELDKNGMMQFKKDARSGQVLTLTAARWRGRNKTMSGLATDLAKYLREPVMDATGLEGEYDYDLVFTPETNTNTGSGAMMSPFPPGGGSGSAAGENVSTQHPFLRDALKEQLGLKLEQKKNVPVHVVVVDSANREPTEN
jgi:uncharacterized protein (TIGR03435 family)